MYTFDNKLRCATSALKIIGIDSIYFLFTISNKNYHLYISNSHQNPNRLCTANILYIDIYCIPFHRCRTSKLLMCTRLPPLFVTSSLLYAICLHLSRRQSFDITSQPFFTSLNIIMLQIGRCRSILLLFDCMDQ